jgi:hypothetical protein
MVRRGKYTVNSGPKRHTRKRKVLSGGGKGATPEETRQRSDSFYTGNKTPVPLWSNKLEKPYVQ